MKSDILKRIYDFKKKYPGTVGWRISKHAEIVDMHLNDGENVRYAFFAQKNDNPFDIITTYVVAITNKRILMGHKRLLFGYMFLAITPDMFNDLSVKSGILWGKIDIDTIKEVVKLSNLQIKSLPEVETEISEYMMEKKKESVKFGKDN